jgi:Flp pilus assembly pilin Flp
MSISHLSGSSRPPVFAQARRCLAGLWGCGRRLAGDRAGVTALEYAIMGLLIFVAIAGALFGFAGGLGNMMSTAFGKIVAAM